MRVAARRTSPLRLRQPWPQERFPAGCASRGPGAPARNRHGRMRPAVPGRCSRPGKHRQGWFTQAETAQATQARLQAGHGGTAGWAGCTGHASAAISTADPPAWAGAGDQPRAEALVMVGHPDDAPLPPACPGRRRTAGRPPVAGVAKSRDASPACSGYRWPMAACVRRGRQTAIAATCGRCRSCVLRLDQAGLEAGMGRIGQAPCRQPGIPAEPGRRRPPR